MAIAKKQSVEKAQLTASLIPKATAEKIIALSTQTFGTAEKLGPVTLGDKHYEVAHDLIKGGYHIIRLPAEEQVLGKGQWNIVVRVCDISNPCFQALRKPIIPPGQQPPSEENIMLSIQIYQDIRNSGLQGTTLGPVALIRSGTRRCINFSL